MSKIRLNLLFISLFFVYTEGLWQRLFLLGSNTTIMYEFPIWLYLFFSQKYFLKYTPLIKYLLLYIFISFSISVFNGFEIINWIKYIRFFIYFILIYLSIFNTAIKIKQWNSIIAFVVFLILIQGLGSSFNIFILDQRIEGQVGLMSTLGGTKAATFPLLIISISYLIYLFSRRSKLKLNLILFLMFVGCLLVGYASGKRIIYFSIPVFFILIAWLSFYKLKFKKYFSRKILISFFIILVIFPLFIFGITTSKGLNYALSGNETNLEIILSAIEYAEYYDNSESFYGESTGRSSTSFNAVSNSLNSTDVFMFGNGYSSHKDENFINSIGIEYGIVGFTRDLLSGGWILVLITLIVYIKIIKTNLSINNNFLDVLRNVILIIFIYTHLTYSSDFTANLKIPLMLAIILAFINSPLNKEALKNILSKYSII